MMPRRAETPASASSASTSSRVGGERRAADPERLVVRLRRTPGRAPARTPEQRPAAPGSGRPAPGAGATMPASRPQLHQADRRLDVGHPVVEAGLQVRLEHRLRAARAGPPRRRSCRARAAGAAGRPSSASSVVSIPPSPVVSSLRGWNDHAASSGAGADRPPVQRRAGRARRVLDHGRRPARRPLAQRAGTSAGTPPWCTGDARPGCAGADRVDGVGREVAGQPGRRRRRPASRRRSGPRWRWR